MRAVPIGIGTRNAVTDYGRLPLRRTRQTETSGTHPPPSHERDMSHIALDVGEVGALRCRTTDGILTTHMFVATVAVVGSPIGTVLTAKETTAPFLGGMTSHRGVVLLVSLQLLEKPNSRRCKAHRRCTRACAKRVLHAAESGPMTCGMKHHHTGLVTSPADGWHSAPYGPLRWV